MNRREYLLSAGTLATTTVTGCLGDDGDDSVDGDTTDNGDSSANGEEIIREYDRWLPEPFGETMRPLVLRSTRPATLVDHYHEAGTEWGIEYENIEFFLEVDGQDQERNRWGCRLIRGAINGETVRNAIEIEEDIEFAADGTHEEFDVYAGTDGHSTLGLSDDVAILSSSLAPQRSRDILETQIDARTDESEQLATADDDAALLFEYLAGDMIELRLGEMTEEPAPTSGFSIDVEEGHSERRAAYIFDSPEAATEHESWLQAQSDGRGMEHPEIDFDGRVGLITGTVQTEAIFTPDEHDPDDPDDDIDDES